MHDLDGISQDIATTPIELDLSASDALAECNRALRSYSKAASRPRKASCWAFVTCWLWNARQDAIRAGALRRGSDEYAFVSDRYADASNRLEYLRAMESAGHGSNLRA